jgi:alkylation response protein AidB-like acyl-CoA dehydrogenase
VIAPTQRCDRGVFPQDSVDAVKSLGLNAIFVPKLWRRADAYRLYLAVVQTISGSLCVDRIIYATNYHGMKPLIDFGTEEQKNGCCRAWLEERSPHSLSRVGGRLRST